MTDQKREAVDVICGGRGLSQRRACRLTGVFLSTCRYVARHPAAVAHLSGRITELTNACALVTGVSSCFRGVKIVALITIGFTASAALTACA